MSAEKRQQSGDDEYVDFSSDVKGFWDHEGIIHLMPTGYKTFPSRKFKNKTTTIIVGKALSEVSALDEDDEKITIAPGELIGVWYSPGMKEILGLYQCKVKMWRDGEKDVGQAQPMKVYRTQIAKSSKPAPVPNLTIKTSKPGEASETAGGTDLPSDDIPF